MKIVKLAAGFAVGYVLGSRAGRDAYQKIAANAQWLSQNPAVRQALEQGKASLSAGTQAATAKVHRAATGNPTATTGPTPRNPIGAGPLEPAAGQPLI